MANPEHVRVVENGAAAIFRWRKENPKIALDLSDHKFLNSDLSRSNFSGIKLDSVFFSDCRLNGLNLSRTDIYHTVFGSSDFSKAKIRSADLLTTRFYDCDFSNVDFSTSDMVGVVFENCYFYGTSFKNCDLGEVVFSGGEASDVDMNGVEMGKVILADFDVRGFKGLENVKHDGPSSLGLDSILLSEGEIPLSFMRGCGLPDHVIEYVRSLSQRPIQYFTCFLSHSHKDEAFIKHLYDKLQGAGVRCWYFPETARTGEPLRREIDKAIRLYDKLVIICSVNSLESKPVIDEIEEGLKREEEEAVRKLKDEEKVASGELDYEDFAKRRYHSQVLFPIMIDDYLLDGWKHPLQHIIKKRVVADFRKWKHHDEFSKQLEKLLRDLNAVETGAPLIVGSV